MKKQVCKWYYLKLTYLQGRNYLNLLIPHHFQRINRRASEVFVPLRESLKFSIHLSLTLLRDEKMSKQYAPFAIKVPAKINSASSKSYSDVRASSSLNNTFHTTKIPCWLRYMYKPTISVATAKWKSIRPTISVATVKWLIYRFGSIVSLSG